MLKYGSLKIIGLFTFFCSFHLKNNKYENE